MLNSSSNEMTGKIQCQDFHQVSHHFEGPFRYIWGGAILFSEWEDWNMLDGSYFCFVSLSTIGFGDIVPGDKIYAAQALDLSFIFCSMYLMLGEWRRPLEFYRFWRSMLQLCYRDPFARRRFFQRLIRSTVKTGIYFHYYMIQLYRAINNTNNHYTF